jgi:aryl-alcohol dehydrogenase-like predicted oxidoreductase
MRYRITGHSGLRIAEAVLGTETFGDAASVEESRRILDLYFEHGGNTLDTASSYANGRSEEVIGELLGAQREKVIIATKYSAANGITEPNAAGNHRRSLVRSVDRSLRRLQTDWIDLLWLHVWDGTTPVEEILRAMDDIVRCGKVLHIGFSNTPAWVVAEALAIGRIRGWSTPTAIQAPYNLASRDAERELLPMAAANSIPMFAWGVLGGGLLTGKYLSPQDNPRRYGEMKLTERVRSLSTAIVSAAKEISATPGQVALAWVKHSVWSAHIIPIIGIRTANQLAENLTAYSLDLPHEVISQLDSIVNFKAGFPSDFLQSDDVLDLLFGRFRGQLSVYPVRQPAFPG